VAADNHVTAMISFIDSHHIADTNCGSLSVPGGVHGDGSSSPRLNVSQRAMVAGRSSTFAETASPETSVSRDLGQEN